MRRAPVTGTGAEGRCRPSPTIRRARVRGS